MISCRRVLCGSSVYVQKKLSAASFEFGGVFCSFAIFAVVGLPFLRPLTAVSVVVIAPGMLSSRSLCRSVTSIKWLPCEILGEGEVETQNAAPHSFSAFRDQTFGDDLTSLPPFNHGDNVVPLYRFIPPASTLVKC